MNRIKRSMVIGNFVGFLCLFAVNNYIYPRINIIKESSFYYFWVFISWLPCIILIGIAFVYTLTMISDKYKKLKPYIYMHVICLVVLVLSIVVYPHIIKFTSVGAINIYAVAVLTASIMFQYVVNSGLSKMKFDIMYEISMLLKVGERYDKSERKVPNRIINRVHIFYLLVFSIEPYFYIFVTILTIGTIVITPNLLKIRKSYAKFDWIGNNKSAAIIICYYIGCILSLPIYNINPLLSILVIHTGTLPQCIFENSLAKKNYLNIENILMGKGESDE